MKILLTSDTYENQINGVSCSVITLRDELRKKGHDVRVLTLSKDSESKMVKTDYLIGSFSVPFYPDTRQTLHFNDRLIDDIVKWKPDIIHIQTEFSIGKISKKIASKCNVPFINTSHTLYEDYTTYVIPVKSLSKVIAKRLVRSSYKNSACIITPSNKIKKLLESYGLNNPMRIIPTGIDLDKFKKNVSLIEKAKLKLKHNIPKKSKILVSIGRLAKEKNLDEIIDYLPDLVKRNKDIILLIGGDGPYRKKLEEKVKKLNMSNYVRFVGMIDPSETYKYYHLGDIFVCASTSETQGITYIEALACGLPLVCRYDPCLDGVLIDENNGYSYKTKKEYLNYIHLILNKKLLHHKLKKNALVSSKKFSREKFCNDVEELYFDVVNKKVGVNNEG